MPPPQSTSVLPEVIFLPPPPIPSSEDSNSVAVVNEAIQEQNTNSSRPDYREDIRIHNEEDNLVSRPPQKRLSGAARRKLARMSAANNDFQRTNARSSYSQPDSRKRQSPRESTDAPASKRTATYKDPPENCLNLAIVNERTTKLSEHEATMIRTQVTQDLWSIADNHTSAPGFRKWNFNGDVILVTCKNEMTARWLQETLTQLPCNVARKYKVIQASKLPKPWKVRIWLPGAAEKDFRFIRGRLAAQNDQPEILKWNCLHHEVKEEGMLAVFTVHEEEAIRLREKDAKLYYNVFMVRVKVQEPENWLKEHGNVNDVSHNTSNDEAQTSMANTSPPESIFSDTSSRILSPPPYRVYENTSLN